MRIWLSLLLLLAAVQVSAYSSEDQDRNHPEEAWFSAETPHFRFHYRQGLREVAQACAARAEAVYPELVDFYGTTPGRIDFVVQDEDYSNGWAIASLATMSIWSSDLGFAFRGTHDWIRDVVAHEFSHIASIQASSKVRSWLSELQVGFGDASNGRISAGGWGLWSLNPYSMALAEGTAQWSSARMGGDRWDTHRQMIERSAALADSLRPWERMSVFSGTGVDFERVVYNQGFSMMRYVEATRGAETIPKWWHSLGSPLPQEWGAAWKHIEGTSGDSLWREWKSAVTAHAQAERDSARPLLEGRRLVGDAYNTGHPRWLSKDTLLFSSNPGADEGNNLWGYDFRDTAKDSSHRRWMVATAIRGRFSLDTAARRVYYVSGRKSDAQDRHVLDAWMAPLSHKDGQLKAPATKEHRQITRTWHASLAELSPSRDTLAVVVRDTRRFRVELVTADGLELPLGNGRQVFPAGDTGVLGTVFGVRWSPDGRSFAVDWFDGKIRRCDLIGRDGSRRRLGDSLSEWRDAAFAPDGKSLYLSSDRTGIYNIYRQDLSNDSLAQLTSVVGGAFEPEASPDGTRLAFAGYDASGFGLWLLDSLRPLSLRPARRPDSLPPPPQEQSYEFEGREMPYSAVPDRFLLTPLAYFQKSASFLYPEGESHWSAMGGARVQLLDPVRRNMAYGMLLLDLTRGIGFIGPGQPNFVNPRQEKMILAGWENRSFPPTLTLQGLYQDMHGEDTLTTLGDRDTLHSRQDFTLHLMQVSAGARYSLTENQKLHADLSWTRYDYDMYQVPLRYTGYQSVSPTLFWTYYDRTDAPMGVDDDPRGLMLRAQWSTDFADVMRTGSSSEVFEQDANGAITAKSSAWKVQRVAAQARLAFGNPLYPDQTLELQGDAASVASWSGPSDSTRLNDFFYESFSLPGYPSLRTRDTRLFQGTHAVWGAIATRLPLWEIDRGLGIWYGDRLLVNGALRAGAAWSKPLWKPESDSMGVSLDWGLSLSGRIHASYPLCLSVNFARALRTVAGIHQEELRLPWKSLPTGAQRLTFGVNLGFDEWSIVDQPLRHAGFLPGATTIR